jgi:hypothetical protein
MPEELEELSAKELIRKTRQEVRKTIRDTEKEIRKWDRDLASLRLDLKKAQAVPDGNKIMSQVLESSIRGIEDTLSHLKTRHARHVAFQGQPSAAFPNGIGFESFSI